MPLKTWALSLLMTSNAPEWSLKRLEIAVGEDIATIVLPNNLNLKADPCWMLLDYGFSTESQSNIKSFVPVSLEEGELMGEIMKQTSSPWNPARNHRRFHGAIN